MGDLQARLWKPMERVLVRYVSKWYDYVAMLLVCFNTGNIISVNIFRVITRNKIQRKQSYLY